VHAISAASIKLQYIAWEREGEMKRSKRKEEAKATSPSQVWAYDMSTSEKGSKGTPRKELYTHIFDGALPLLVKLLPRRLARRLAVLASLLPRQDKGNGECCARDLQSKSIRQAVGQRQSRASGRRWEVDQVVPIHLGRCHRRPDGPLPRAAERSFSSQGCKLAIPSGREYRATVAAPQP
jgi:hypothetical protein